MQTLNLGGIQLPASKFPEPADSYICDNCGRDITRYLHPGRAHVSTPLGPPWYVCRCGQRYISGAVEWDSLSAGEHRKRLIEVVGLGIASLIPIGGFAVLVSLAIRHHSIPLTIASGVAAMPLIVFVPVFTISGLEVFEIAASLWRTRVVQQWSARVSK